MRVRRRKWLEIHTKKDNNIKGVAQKSFPVRWTR